MLNTAWRGLRAPGSDRQTKVYRGCRSLPKVSEKTADVVITAMPKSIGSHKRNDEGANHQIGAKTKLATDENHELPGAVA